MGDAYDDMDATRLAAGTVLRDTLDGQSLYVVQPDGTLALPNPVNGEWHSLPADRIIGHVDVEVVWRPAAAEGLRQLGLTNGETDD